MCSVLLLSACQDGQNGERAGAGVQLRTNVFAAAETGTKLALSVSLLL